MATFMRPYEPQTYAALRIVTGFLHLGARPGPVEPRRAPETGGRSLGV